MKNEDEELRGLEGKLGRLKPRDMDESYVAELMESLDQERDKLTGRRNEGAYPTNVLWVRFAPVAAAAGVVLLGTFFLRYESQMGELQSQRSDSAEVGKGMAVASNPVNSGLTDLPVPRLGVSENYGMVPVSQGAPGLLPVSAQNYLQPAGEVFGDFYKNGTPVNASLHFEDAYDWQDARDRKSEVGDQ